MLYMSVQYVYLHIQLFIKSLDISYIFQQYKQSSRDLLYSIYCLIQVYCICMQIKLDILYPTLYREVCNMCSILPGEGY